METRTIMNQLAELTSARDVELLEMSLLKTLVDALDLPSAMLLTLNSDETYELCGYVHRASITGTREYAEQGSLPPPADSLVARFWGGVDQAQSTQSSVVLIDDDGGGSVYPLVIGDTIAGYVLVEDSETLGSREYHIINGILKVFNNYYALLEDSQRDKLTGLLNRKTFEERIGRVLAAAVERTAKLQPRPKGEHRRPRDGAKVSRFWLGIMDIDHFKRINDNFGHVYGDEVLLLIARLMRQSFRANDLLFRFGGEEFVVVVEAPTREEAADVFDRFRQTVEDHEFPQVGKVTISLGAVELDQTILPTELIGYADQALYFAKRNGRNRVVFYEELVAAGLGTPAVKHGSVDLF